MRLAGFRHRGLRQLYKTDDHKGLSAATVDKLRKILFVMETADDLTQVARFPGWELHALKGEMKGFWSLTITGNWRLVFRYDGKTNSATDIDLVDYH